jgi:hypothetical protein
MPIGGRINRNGVTKVVENDGPNKYTYLIPKKYRTEPATRRLNMFKEVNGLRLQLHATRGWKPAHCVPPVSPDEY